MTSEADLSAPLPPTRDHGGNLTAAITHFGGRWEDWLDISTGINPTPYPVGAIAAHLWTRLPDQALHDDLIVAARKAYGAGGAIAATAGAQQVIDTLPHLVGRGVARVLAPTYNEHAAALRHAGWQVQEVSHLQELAGADLAVVVNPNNPDGRFATPAQLLALHAEVGTLVVDESFGDATPELSLAAETWRDNLWVMRSFGKFYGLAGLRLGFALASPSAIAGLKARLGPWPVNGPAMAIGARALCDTEWQSQMTACLEADSQRLDRLAPWPLLGGTSLFRLYQTPDAVAVQEHLARHHIWTRIFPYSAQMIRLGLPDAARWGQVERALASLPAPLR